jgi:hypothetical protein
MSNRNERPAPEVAPPAPPGAHVAGGLEVTPVTQQNHQVAASNADQTVELKRRLEETRLPGDLKAQILAELPSPEEQERLYRELQEKGGLSFEEFSASLL